MNIPPVDPPDPAAWVRLVRKLRRAGEEDKNGEYQPRPTARGTLLHGWRFTRSLIFCKASRL